MHLNIFFWLSLCQYILMKCWDSENTHKNKQNEMKLPVLSDLFAFSIKIITLY